jgi:uncharacterized membrane protein YgdD (TMEM256/DUF423 family)
MMPSWLAIGSALGGLGVALGAFGAHALRARVSPERLAVWQTATEYHLVHALALLAVGLLLRIAPQAPAAQAAGVCFSVGILLFSGSLYLLVLLDQGWLGAITPFGGVLLIAGWALLAFSAFRLG